MDAHGQCLLISASDTGCGKTVVTAALALALGKVGVIKLVQAGPGDREYYQQVLSLDQTPEELNPLYFAAPLAPPLAAAREGRSIDLALAWQQLTRLRQRYPCVLVEGVGGLGSPVTWEWTVADLAAQWRLPTLLVVPAQLGAIGQTVAQVALARQTGAPLAGIVLNERQPLTPEQREDWVPVGLIQRLTRVPVWGYVPHVADIYDRDALKKAGLTLMENVAALWKCA
ncbi:MAG: dethiobiotin synthase [Gloeomargarita sp. SKYBB_i_bin120]|nr:dethiobiotin synthase [Gloeomargarita sp. SKYG98]MCS7293322.1 dethiobiotin synthase [Gloeomargarita sp. SKYB120]MDW8178887.1 dethiobiotin synthase [Gloeomargarita sp. SKYBB_i_bin120]